MQEIPIHGILWFVYKMKVYVDKGGSHLCSLGDLSLSVAT